MLGRKNSTKKSNRPDFCSNQIPRKHEKWNQKAVFIARNNNNTKNTISLKQTNTDKVKRNELLLTTAAAAAAAAASAASASAAAARVRAKRIRLSRRISGRLPLNPNKNRLKPRGGSKLCALRGSREPAAAAHNQKPGKPLKTSGRSCCTPSAIKPVGPIRNHAL